LNLVALKIPSGWKVNRNVFFALNPTDEYSEDELSVHLFDQEDLLQLEFNDYFIDLGWYMGKDGSFGLNLIKGNWLEGLLLERFVSRSYKDVAERINDILKAIDDREFEDVKGLPIDNNQSQFENYEPRMKKPPTKADDTL